MKVYSVSVHMPSYCSDNVSYCQTLAQAINAAKWEKKSFYDMGAQGEYKYNTIRVLGDIAKDWRYEVYEARSWRDWTLKWYITIEKLDLTEEEIEWLETYDEWCE